VNGGDDCQQNKKRRHIMADQKKTKVVITAVTDLEKKYPANKYNRLLPSTLIGELSPLQKLSIEVVQIDPDPEHKEIYEVRMEKGKDGRWCQRYALSKTALDKIAHTIGISWIPGETRRVDDRSNPRIVEFKAVGILKKTDGTLQVLSGTKEIDLDAMESELRLKLKEKARHGKLKKGREVLKANTQACIQEIEYRVSKRMIEVQKHKVALAESGAKNRAIRSLGLKSSYSKEDLKKPFVVPRIDFNPELALADPELKREIVREAMAVGTQLYGVGQTVTSMTWEKGSRKEEVVEAEYEEDLELDDTSDEQMVTPEEERALYLEGLTTEERVDVIKKLAKRKGRRIQPKPFSEKPIKTQVKNILWMESLPDEDPDPVTLDRDNESF